MAKKILVPLKRDDNIEDIIPYVEKVAQPGMKFVFLVPYRVELRLQLQDRWMITDSPTRAMFEGRKIVDRYSWEVQKRLAEQKVAPARDILAKEGIEMTVDLYTGSLRKGVADYVANGDVHLIIMRAGRIHAILGLGHRMIFPFALFKRPSFSPVLLLNPDQAVAHS